MADALYQHFEAPAAGGDAARIAALRAAIGDAGLDGLIIPHSDEFQNEYLPACNERLAEVSGFTGSAGTAVMLTDRAALFVDGRYILQAPTQADTDIFEIHQVPKARVSAWIASTAPAGARIGYDPWTHTVLELKALTSALSAHGIELTPTDKNLVDQTWTDRPAFPAGSARPHALAHAGRTVADKIAEITAAMKSAGVKTLVLAIPESIAWLFNIRGADVPHTPIPLSRALVEVDGTATLFLAPGSDEAALTSHLGTDISVAPLDRFAEALSRIDSGTPVMLDPATTPAAIAGMLTAAGAEILEKPDPCLLPKARKNAAEISGAREAHQRDGLALTRFLAWLSREAPGGTVSEITAATQLETFRRASNQLTDLSFDTISGAGPNGAIVHYRVSRDTNRLLEPGSLYLVDSGGQYPDGTTDVTRTVAIGMPREEMRQRFTLVLKGHIAIARCRFPEGTTGAQIEALARVPLWQAGLDYDHGTGHGVGAYLSVHEGPQGLSPRAASVALEPGMIVSNEPGYYKAGEYGIRIENLVVVSEATMPPGGDRAMLSFETLTLAPIDRTLIVTDMLSADELAWLDAYHARVAQALSPHLDAADRDWLAAAAAPLSPRAPV